MEFVKTFAGICAVIGGGGLVVAVVGFFGLIKDQSSTTIVIVLLSSLSCIGVAFIVGLLVDCIGMLRDIKKHSQ
jgi:hypothetical protein